MCCKWHGNGLANKAGQKNMAYAVAGRCSDYPFALGYRVETLLLFKPWPAGPVFGFDCLNNLHVTEMQQAVFNMNKM